MKLQSFDQYGCFGDHRMVDYQDWDFDLRKQLKDVDYNGKLAELKVEQVPEMIVERLSILADYFNAVWQLYAIRRDEYFRKYPGVFKFEKYTDLRSQYNDYVLALVRHPDQDVAWAALLCLAEPLCLKGACKSANDFDWLTPFGDVRGFLDMLRQLALDPSEVMANPYDGIKLWAARKLEQIAIAITVDYDAIHALQQDNYRWLHELAEDAAVLAVQTALDLGIQPRNMSALTRKFRGDLFYQCLLEGPLDLDCDGIGYWGMLGLTDEQALNVALHGKTKSIRNQAIDMLHTEQYVEFIRQTDDLSGVRFPRENESGSYYGKTHMHANTHFATLYIEDDEDIFLKIGTGNVDEYTRDTAISHLRTPESYDKLIEMFGVNFIDRYRLRFLSQNRLMQVYREHPDDWVRGHAVYYIADQDFICKEAFKKENKKDLVVNLARSIEDQRVVKKLLFVKDGKQAKHQWREIIYCLKDEEVIREAIAEARKSHPEYVKPLVERLPEDMWREFGFTPPDDDDVSLHDANGYPYMDEFEYMNNL